ncbi:MAG TPA: ATP-binding protein [Kofleriaceae bacterium]|nr:ATP-binding protein [Kofleriaceae bacterium]
MGSINLITLEKPTADEVPLQTQLNETLVRELLATAKGGAAGLLVATFLCWLLVHPWPGHAVTAAFAALIGVTATRLVGSIWIERRLIHRMPYMRVFLWLAVIYASNGASLAVFIVAACPHLPVVSTLMLLVIMIGINSTAMVTMAASPLVYVLYLSPTLAAWFIVAFTDPLPGLEHALQGALPVYGIVMAFTMRTVHRRLRHNIVLRLRLGASLGDLRDAQARLVEASREAGRSDVATAVLHNVGNVLNSVNVSAVLVNDIVTNLRTAKLSQIATMITEHGDDLARFFHDDARGQKLPLYFEQLHVALERDKAAAATELQSLIRNIDHIKVIVSSQQSHVKPSGAIETFDARDLLDDALKFSVSATEHHAIEVIRRFDAVPPVSLDRHKVLQIVMNLLTNARDAVLTKPAGERQIIVSTRAGDNASLEIGIEDNGCGVDPQHLDRIFHLGFTTKTAGNGLGLHYSACAARELHGNLTARSEGVGRGASFLLVLPLDAMAAR